MKYTLLILTLCLSLARAQEFQAVMADGPLRLAGPQFDADGTPTNLLVGSVQNGGMNFSLNADWTWAGGPAVASTLGGGNRDFVIVGGGSNDVWSFGTLHVGMPGYGSGSLIVRDTITSAGHPVPRWLGESASEPDSPQGGDQYYDSTTSKVRIFTGSAWIDLN